MSKKFILIAKRYIAVLFVVIVWLSLHIYLSTNSIQLGGIPYGLIFGILTFVLFILARKSGEEKDIDDNKILMRNYDITIAQDGKYKINDETFSTFDEALAAARYSNRN
jgi:hypothetical protein